MRWPRGRFNDRRIVGIVVRIRIDVTRWRRVQLWPRVGHGECFRLGPLMVWIEAAYD